MVTTQRSAGKPTTAAIDALRARICRTHFSFTSARSGGPGGQNVNKVNTRVTLWFDVNGSDLLSTWEKRRIRARLSGRVSNEGWMRVISSKHRTQLANRRAVEERFYELMVEALRQPKPRKATRVPLGTKRRRIEGKRQRGQVKRDRGRRPSTDDV